MSGAVETRQTVLGAAFFDERDVISFRQPSGEAAKLVYCVAQQAMIGKRFKERYPVERVPFPYAEFFDISMLPSPAGDNVAESAAAWLEENAHRGENGGVTWLHDFDFVFMNKDLPVYSPWLSAVGQANALLACLHWFRHTGEEKWRRMAEGAVDPFCRPLSIEDGVSYAIKEGMHWFEEYPTANPSHILNCHLLSLVSLEHAGRILNSGSALSAFSKGWEGLKAWIHRYDREYWSRYDQPRKLFLFLRLVPSVKGKACIGDIELSVPEGIRICRLDAVKDEASDQPVSRLAGIDWGPAETAEGRRCRRVPNRQDYHQKAIPHGGTDQNTYLIFEEGLDFGLYSEKGLVLSLEVWLEGGAELDIEFRDPRHEGLVFGADPSIKRLSHEGWATVNIQIPPRLSGHPLSQHYHRFNTELLGTLLQTNQDEELERIFNKWHRADLYNMPSEYPPPGELPKTVFVFVNDKCGLRCKMCDFGVSNEEASLAQMMAGRGNRMDPGVLTGLFATLGTGPGELSLRLTGTEPLLYPHYRDVLKEAKKRGLNTGITTNGLMLEKEAEALIDIRIDELALSIDGPPQIHDEIRGHRGLFDRILKGVESLKRKSRLDKSRCPDIDISFTISRDNHLRITEFFDSIKAIEPRSVVLSHLNFVTPETARAHNQAYPGLLISPSSVEAWEDALKMDFYGLFWQLEEARKIKWTEVCIIPFTPTPSRLKWYYTNPELPMSRAVCAAPWYSVQVLTDGTVTVLGRCFRVDLGDLRKETLRGIWSGRGYENMRAFLKGRKWLAPCMRCCGSL